MTDVIDHLYRKAVWQQYGAYSAEWDKRYEAIKTGGAAGLIDAVGGPHADLAESLRNILVRMAQDIAELQKERQ